MKKDLLTGIPELLNDTVEPEEAVVSVIHQLLMRTGVIGESVRKDTYTLDSRSEWVDFKTTLFTYILSNGLSLTGRTWGKAIEFLDDWADKEILIGSRTRV